MRKPLKPELAPTSLTALEQSGAVVVAGDKLAFSVRQAWIVPGEDRLSYGTIVRLAECSRELHWRRDIEREALGTVDSICARLSCEFKRPLIIGEQFVVKYHILSVRAAAYVLLVQFVDRNFQRVHAEVCIECVFYDAARRRGVRMPSHIMQGLRKLLERRSSAEHLFPSGLNCAARGVATER